MTLNYQSRQPRSGFRRGVFNAGFRSTQTILLNILSIPATAYIIRKLGPTGYGQWTTALALVGTFTILTNLGLRGSFVRAVARDPDAAPSAMAQQLGTRLALALLAAVVVICTSVALHYSGTILACILLGIVGLCFSTIFTTASDLMEAFQRFPAAAIASFFGGLVLTVLSVLAVRTGGGPVAVSFAYLVGPLLSAGVLLTMLRQERFRLGFDLNLKRASLLLWTSRHFSAQQLLYAASSNIALLMLPRLIGVQQFGLFTAGILLVTRLAFIPDAFGTAFYPLMARLFGRDERTARRYFISGIFLSCTICFAIAVSVTLLAPFIAQILFPKTPSVCARVIVVTIWALPLIAAESMVNYALNAARHEAALARASFCAASLNLVIGAFLIMAQGLEGACCYLLVRPAIQIVCSLPSLSLLLKGESAKPFERPRSDCVHIAVLSRPANMLE